MGVLHDVRRSDADDADRRVAWSHPFLAWHLMFWFLLLMITMAAFIVSGGRGNWIGLVGVLAVLGAGYHFLGGPAAERQEVGRARLYSVLVVLCCGVGTAFVVEAAFLLFVVLPQVWHLSRGIVGSLLWVTAVLGAVATGTLANQGFTTDVLVEMLPWLAVTLVVAIGLGVSIDRLVQQSVQQAQLVVEVRRARGALVDAHHAAGAAAERERLAGEIHDTLAQGFTSIVLLAQAASTDPTVANHRLLGLIEETARENLAEARALVAGFTPVALDGTTLSDALRRLGGRYGRESAISVEVRIALAEEDVATIPAALQVVMLRAAQEGLANVRKHARAQNAVVVLGRAAAAVYLEITDDGVGFDRAEARSGFGLDGMVSRVEQAGGSVVVDSAPGDGTRVRIQVPLEVAEPEVAR